MVVAKHTLAIPLVSPTAFGGGRDGKSEGLRLVKVYEPRKVICRKHTLEKIRFVGAEVRELFIRYFTQRVGLSYSFTVSDEITFIYFDHLKLYKPGSILDQVSPVCKRLS